MAFAGQQANERIVLSNEDGESAGFEGTHSKAPKGVHKYQNSRYIQAALAREWQDRDRMDRRRKPRSGPDSHPLAEKAKLRPSGPALERRKGSRSKSENGRVTLQLPAELVERLRNAVYWTPGLTLTAVAAEALRRLLLELEDQRGGPFPKRDQELRIGRPVK